MYQLRGNRKFTDKPFVLKLVGIPDEINDDDYEDLEHQVRTSLFGVLFKINNTPAFKEQEMTIDIN